MMKRTFMEDLKATLALIRRVATEGFGVILDEEQPRVEQPKVTETFVKC